MKIFRSYVFFSHLLINVLCTFSSNAQDTYTMGVTEHVINGLQKRTMDYIVMNSDLRIKVVGVPFERKLRLLETGKIDIAMGVLKTPEREKRFIYVAQPYHVFEGVSIFLNSNSDRTIKSSSDLKGLTVAIVHSSRDLSYLDSEVQFDKLNVRSLRRSLDLLLDNKVDAVFAIESVANRSLKRRKQMNSIRVAEFKPYGPRDVHMVISKHSKLKEKKAILEELSKELYEGKYDEIRNAYFHSKMKKNQE